MKWTERVKTPNFRYLIEHSDFDDDLKKVFLSGRVTEIKIEDKYKLYYASIIIYKKQSVESKLYQGTSTDQESQEWHLTIKVLFD